jgi:hypothetical protein
VNWQCLKASRALCYWLDSVAPSSSSYWLIASNLLARKFSNLSFIASNINIIMCELCFVLLFILELDYQSYLCHAGGNVTAMGMSIPPNHSDSTAPSRRSPDLCIFCPWLRRLALFSDGRTGIHPHTHFPLPALCRHSIRSRAEW